MRALESWNIRDQRFTGLITLLSLLLLPTAAAADNTSLRNEIQHSIDRGLAWLSANQNSNGWWQTPDHPAVTGLALTAFNGDPMDRYRGKESPNLKKAYGYIVEHAKPDGSICVTNLPTYNTAVSILALLSSNDSRYDSLLRQARKFLAAAQHDFGEKGKLDTPHDGGFGYGLPNDKVSDMSNTLLALEAMSYSRRLKSDQPGGATTSTGRPRFTFFRAARTFHLTIPRAGLPTIQRTKAGSSTTPAVAMPGLKPTQPPAG